MKVQLRITMYTIRNYARLEWRWCQSSGVSRNPVITGIPQIPGHSKCCAHSGLYKPHARHHASIRNRQALSMSLCPNSSLVYIIAISLL